jgi:hypothetical protein
MPPRLRPREMGVMLDDGLCGRISRPVGGRVRSGAACGRARRITEPLSIFGGHTPQGATRAAGGEGGDGFCGGRGDTLQSGRDDRPDKRGSAHGPERLLSPLPIGAAAGRI